MQPRPRTIQIYLPKGDPRGIRVAELTTSIVRVTEVPRALLDQFQDMPEAKQVALDSDVQLTHYRLRKMGERTLDLESGDVVKLPGIKEAGTGTGGEDEKKELREIIKRMNDLFAGDITDADFLGVVTNWQGRLMTNEGLASQAKNNSEDQFAMSRFKDAFMDVVIDAQDAQNSIADQMLKDPRIFGVVQSMPATMVWKGFNQIQGMQKW